MEETLNGFEEVGISQALQKKFNFLLIMHGIAVLHYLPILYFVTFVLSVRKAQAGLGSQWKNPGLKFKKTIAKQICYQLKSRQGRERVREREREFKKQREILVQAKEAVLEKDMSISGGVGH